MYRFMVYIRNARLCILPAAFAVRGHLQALNAWYKTELTHSLQLGVLTSMQTQHAFFTETFVCVYDNCMEPAGDQRLRLRVCKNRQKPVDVAVWDLPVLPVTPSDMVVSSIEVAAPAPVIAGSLLPSLS